MLKKSDTLPLILALVSTALIVATGFNWLTTSDIAGLNQKKFSAKTKVLKTPNAQANSVSSKTSVASTQKDFMLPVIVPQGTSVSINGSSNLNAVNISLRKAFHQKYPGTVIITNADGDDIGLDQLYSGDIDLLALDRSLNPAEKAAGLVAIQMNQNQVNQNQTDIPWYYVYKKPLDADTEAFLGYAVSELGKEAIKEH